MIWKTLSKIETFFIKATNQKFADTNHTGQQVFYISIYLGVFSLVFDADFQYEILFFLARTVF